MALLILYVIIGLMVTEAGIQEDENYKNILRGDKLLYIYEILNWLPGTIEYIIENKNETE